MSKRAFIIVLDSMGIGHAPDAEKFNDAGSNTLLSISKSKEFNTENLKKMGLFNIDKVEGEKETNPTASFARLIEASNGKDTTIGHWEIAGVESENPLPTYPNGFPKEVVDEYEKLTGKKVICNLPYSGTQLLEDYGEEHMKTGDLILYTSADSVFQVAAHEEIVPIEKLYEYCQTARDMLKGEHAVGRVIARPFVGSKESGFTRTKNRHDYSLKAPKKTVLEYIKEAGKEVIGVGKIYDIYDGDGITKQIKTANNEDGMDKTIEIAKEDFDGLCFVNLVDFDMVYGHRNNIDGYAGAMTAFDKRLGELLEVLRDDDILFITADHGCDPGTESTDHSRECVPLLIYGKNIKSKDLGVLTGFAHIGATVAEYLGVSAKADRESLLKEII